jgi:hypothetical protein
MDNSEKEIKEIEELIEKLSKQSMGNINQAQLMETNEKILKAKIGKLTYLSLKDTNIILNNFNNDLNRLQISLSNLDESIKNGIESNKEYGISIKRWTIVLAVTAVLSAGIAIKYTQTTKELSRTAQEQLDLQLQPALMVISEGSPESDFRYLRLVNIGYGVGLNIKITSDNDNISFVDIPSLIYSTSDKSLRFIDKALNRPTVEAIRQSSNAYSFKQNNKLVINLDYENVNNKKYFTKVEISKDGFRLIGRGERKN